MCLLLESSRLRHVVVELRPTDLGVIEGNLVHGDFLLLLDKGYWDLLSAVEVDTLFHVLAVSCTLGLGVYRLLRVLLLLVEGRGVHFGFARSLLQEFLNEVLDGLVLLWLLL